jgi:hypothetical protein
MTVVSYRRLPMLPEAALIRWALQQRIIPIVVVIPLFYWGHNTTDILTYKSVLPVSFSLHLNCTATCFDPSGPSSCNRSSIRHSV